jgi:hypothetical protein
LLLENRIGATGSKQCAKNSSHNPLQGFARAIREFLATEAVRQLADRPRLMIDVIAAVIGLLSLITTWRFLLCFAASGSAVLVADDPFEQLDELTKFVEALRPQWPKRPILKMAA